jgi:hypothetical protein
MFGDRVPVFEADLADHFEPHLHDGAVVEEVSFAYELFRKSAN